MSVSRPLRDAAFRDEDVLAASLLLGLPSAGKPSYSCLASSIPCGERITLLRLKRIEKGERYLKSMGCAIVRVRDHGKTARIEVDDPRAIMSPKGRRAGVSAYFRSLGYAHVAVDLDGYREGSVT